MIIFFFRWSLIAGRVPGRTDNQVKNHWNTHLSKKLGLKKGKTKIIASLPSSSKELPENFNVHSESNFELPSCYNGETASETVNSDGPCNIFRFSSIQEGMIDNDSGSSFWFFNDDLSLHAPYLTEPLDGYSLDYVWDGL